MPGIATPMQQALLRKGVSGESHQNAGPVTVASPLSANRTYNALNTPIARALSFIAPAPVTLFSRGVSYIADRSVKDAASNYGISSDQVDAGRSEGDASQINASPMTGANANLGSIGTGGQGGIDSAGDNGPADDGCCFIMLEARYGDGTMDDVVRRYRDENMTKRNRVGYYKIAQVIVPMMRHSKIVKFAVTKLFADPLVSYGKWKYGKNKHGFIFSPVKSFWMKLFDVVGQDTQFIRENGEYVD